MTAWPAADGINVRDALTLQDIARDYGRYYDLWFKDGTYYARFITAGKPLEADTPAGLESAIRADAWRRTAS